MHILTFYAIGTVVVFLSATVVFLLSIRNHLRVNHTILYVLVIASLYMFIAQYLKYNNLHSYADFSHWAELINNIVTTGKPNCLSAGFIAPGGANYLSIHFVPLSYILAVPFKVWPHCTTMILLNYVIMAGSAVPLYKLATLCSGQKRFGLITSVLLLWYPTFQYIVLYEFEMLRFSIPVIFCMLLFWEKRRLAMYYICVFLAVLIREDIGLTITMFGLYLFAIEKEHRVGFITGMVGLTAFYIITKIVMPSLSLTTGYSHVASSSFIGFGASPHEAFIGAIKNPTLFICTVFQLEKIANIFMLFLPLLLIPFFASSALISILANIGVGMLSNSNVHYSYMLYYISPSVPFIFYAFIKGWPKFINALAVINDRIINKTNSDLNTAAIQGVLAGLVAANVFFGPSPISLQFWFKDLRPAPFRTMDFRYSAYRPTEHNRKGEELCNLIPDSAIVSAHRTLFTRLFKKKGTIVFPQLETKDGMFKADYVIFDITNNGLKKESPAYIKRAEFDIVANDKKGWKLIKSEDGYFLYKRIRH